jgi:hypothetical protein
MPRYIDRRYVPTCTDGTGTPRGARSHGKLAHIGLTTTPNPTRPSAMHNNADTFDAVGGEAVGLESLVLIGSLIATTKKPLRAIGGVDAGVTNQSRNPTILRFRAFSDNRRLRGAIHQCARRMRPRGTLLETGFSGRFFRLLFQLRSVFHLRQAQNPLLRARLLQKARPSERGRVRVCLGDLPFRSQPGHVAHRTLLEIGAFGGEAAANRFRIGIGPQVGQIRQQDVLGLG